MNIKKIFPKKREHSLSLNRYLNIISTKDQLTYYKIIPHTSSRNYKSIEIPKIINTCYEEMKNRVSIENKMITFKMPTKVGYYIYMNKKTGVEFFLICPTAYKNIFLEKIYQSWDKVEVLEVNNIPRFNKKCSKASMEYVKDNALSLNVISKKSNEVLRHQINVVDVMEDDSERVGIYYNFQPINFYNQLGFKTNYCKTMDKIKKGKSVSKVRISFGFIIEKLLHCGFNIGEEMRNLIVELLDQKDTNLKNKANYEDYLINEVLGVLEKKELSKDTKDKALLDVLKTQIVVFSEADNKKVEKSNLHAVTQSFQVLDGDNKLRPRNILKRKIVDLDKSNIIPKANYFDSKRENFISVQEASSMIVTPSREVIKKYNIPSNDVTEVSIPKACQSGYIPLGVGTVGRKKTGKQAYLNLDADIDTGLLIMGKQGVGKTKFQVRYVKSCADNGESCVVADYIGKNDLCNEIQKVVPKEKTIVIDLSNIKSLPSIAYNEIYYVDGASIEDKMDVIALKTQYNVQLINSFNDGHDLSASMRRFLVSASNLTYAHNQYASFQDTIDCLEDYDTRMNIINSLPEDLKPYLEDDIKNIKKLNAKYTTGPDKGKENGETNETKIDRILDRVYIMKESMRTKIMFSKSSEDNINFEKAFDEGKIILIKMPQNLFGTENVRNFLTLYFTTKVWASCVNREAKIDDYKKLKRVHLIIDEVFQVQKTVEMLEDKLPQVRKFRLKPVFSTHNLSQIDTIKDAIKSAGFSYMMLAGTDKSNFKALSEELSPFEVEDLLNLKRFSSLNLIADDNGRLTPFVTELPPLFDKSEVINDIDSSTYIKESKVLDMYVANYLNNNYDDKNDDKNNDEEIEKEVALDKNK